MSRFRNFAPQAAANLDDAVSWLLDGPAGPAGAEKLLAAVLEAGELIANRPLVGRRRPDLLPTPYRVWSLPRLGYILVYNPTTTPARVIRVLNAARDLPRALKDTDF